MGSVTDPGQLAETQIHDPIWWCKRIAAKTFVCRGHLFRRER